MQPLRKETRPRSVYPVTPATMDGGRIGPILGPPPLPGSHTQGGAPDATSDERPGSTDAGSTDDGTGSDVDEKGAASATHLTPADAAGSGET